MSIKKQFLKSKPICKVTFRIPKNEAKDFSSASIVGSFNEWNPEAHKMKKLKKDGSFTTVIPFEKGSEIHFRYLLDGKHWSNDAEADKQVTNEFGDSENSVLILS